MRLTLAIAVAALIAASPVLAQTASPPPEPAAPNAAKSEDALSGKTPPKNERGGKEPPQQGTETGWGGQWKVPEDGKAQPGRNEAEGQSVKQPEQGK